MTGERSNGQGIFFFFSVKARKKLCLISRSTRLLPACQISLALQTRKLENLSECQNNVTTTRTTVISSLFSFV